METSGVSFRNLPLEIVRLVLEHLRGDKASLRAAILVNRTWAAEGISVLWGYLFAGELLSIESGHRRQYYASQVRTLIARGTAALHDIFRSLEFPKLKCAIVECSEYGDKGTGKEVSVNQYLQPSLEIFNFSGAVLAADSFGLLESQCPRLKSLEIWRMPGGMRSNRLVKFLENCVSLEKIALYWDEPVGEPIDDQVFTHLAGRDGLLGLRMSRSIRYDTLKTAFDTIQSRPFKNIDHLDIELESKAVAPLTAAITSATILSLQVQDDEVVVLPAIASLVGLISLEVVHLEDVELLDTDILALKSLKNLTQLSLLSPRTEVSCDTFTDHDFHELVAGMANLKHLVFQIEFELSIASMITLGTHCRHLRYCELFGAQMNLFELANIQAPLFPALEIVHLDATGTDDAAERNSWTRYQAFLEADTLAESIIIHAPQLKKLHFVKEGGLPICGHVLNAFHAKTGAEVAEAEVSEANEYEWYEF